MTTDQFIDIVKSVRVPPVDYLLASLTNAVKHADPDVHAAFFASEPAAPYVVSHKAQLDPVLQEFAVKYASFVLATKTNYGFNTTIQNADPNLINNWFAADTNRANKVGQNMLLDYMMQPSLLGDYFKDPKNWAAKIAAVIGNDVFLTGLLVESDLTTQMPPRIMLLVLREMDDAGPNFKQVLQAWSASPKWQQVAGYDAYPWLGAVQPSFAQNAPAYNAIDGFVARACTDHAPPYHYPVSTATGVKGIISTTYYTRTEYGPTVATWLRSPNGPARYGLRSQANPTNQSVVQDGGSGCVIAGTPILMADGFTKPVETIREGDRIASGDGAISVCSCELVVNDSLTQLYGINDDAPFMSFEHAVMTQRGWCSLAPQVSMELTPHHTVKYLTKGDVVWKARGFKDGRLEYDKVVVERINIGEYAPGTAPVGFDLHLRSGQPSYHALGYCCLVSYPEITAQRITSNVLSEMSLAEQMVFLRQVEEISPLLGKALGVPVLTVVKKALREPRAVAARARHTDRLGVKRRHVRGAAHAVVARLDVATRAGSPAFATPIRRMALMHGHLFIDGAIVSTHCDEQHVFWNRTLPDGTAEHGALRLAPHGLQGDGVVRQGSQLVPFTAAGLHEYQVTCGSDHKPWFDVGIGFRPDANGNPCAVGELGSPSDPALDTQLKAQGIATVIFSLAHDAQSQTVLHATVEIAPTFCAFGRSPWVAAEIDFTMDYHHFTGTAYAYDESQRGYRGAAQPLFGTCTDQTVLADMRRVMTATMLAQPLARGFLDTAAPHGLVADAVQPALALAGDVANSVNDLFTSTPPDRTNLHDLAFGKLKNLMLLALGKENETYLSWFGETAPSVGKGAALEAVEAALADDPDINKFLIDQFAYGYLAQAFSQSTEANIKQKFAAMAQVNPKLRYFWKGDGDTSFAKSKGYNLATAKLLDSSYSAVMDLDRYLADNPVSWAKQLYDHCTGDTILNGLALQNTLDGQQKLTHLCALLHALDPIARIERPGGKAIGYASSLYERVIDVRLNEVIKFATAADQVDYAQFLTTFYKQLFASLLEGGNWDQSIRTAATQDLEALMKQFDVDNANDLVNSLGTFVADTVSLLLRTRNSPFSTRIQNVINSSELIDRHPNLKWILTKSTSVLSIALPMGVYAYGMWQAVDALMDWDELSPLAKAQSVVTIAQIVASLFSDLAGYRLKALETIATRNADVADLIPADGVMMDTFSSTSSTPLLDDMARAGDEALGDALNPTLVRGGSTMSTAIGEAGNLDAAIARWTRISNIATKVAEGISVIALAGACVGGGFQIANDFATGQPVAIKVLDIVSEVANALNLIVDVAIMAGASIPIVGVVLAVIGVLISFISLFIHRNPPPTPQEIFVDEHCAPFIAALDVPPQKWLDDQSKSGKSGGGSTVAFA